MGCCRSRPAPGSNADVRPAAVSFSDSVVRRNLDLLLAGDLGALGSDKPEWVRSWAMSRLQ